jgi:hypothetical protein
MFNNKDGVLIFKDTNNNNKEIENSTKDNRDLWKKTITTISEILPISIVDDESNLIVTDWGNIDNISKNNNKYKINIIFAGEKQTIKDMFDKQERQRLKYNSVKYPSVKCYDEVARKFTTTKVKEIFYTGKKEVFELVISASDKTKKIKATKDHKFLTKDGWKRLEEIKESDFVALNGQPLYRDKEWLKEQKEIFLNNKIGLQGMSKSLNINYTSGKTLVPFRLSGNIDWGVKVPDKDELKNLLEELAKNMILDSYYNNGFNQSATNFHVHNISIFNKCFKWDGQMLKSNIYVITTHIRVVLSLQKILEKA